MKLFATFFLVAAVLASGFSASASSAEPAKSAKPDLAKGEASYGAACAACHGADGKGNTALGAPNLTDKVWLHGWGEEAIVAMVSKGKLNQMPAQEGRLTPSQIHVLGAYVWGLSNTANTKP